MARRVLDRASAEAIRPPHEWTGTFQRLWQAQLGRVTARAEAGRKRPQRQ